MSNTLPTSAAASPDALASPPPLYQLQQMCLGLLCSAPARRIHHGSTPWETEGDGAGAKPTICRRLEINDRPKPDGSSSRSAASAATAPPPAPNPPSFPQIYVLDLHQSRWTAAWKADLVAEARPRPQGARQVEPAGLIGHHRRWWSPQRQHEYAGVPANRPVPHTHTHVNECVYCRAQRETKLCYLIKSPRFPWVPFKKN